MGRVILSNPWLISQAGCREITNRPGKLREFGAKRRIEWA
jgi:hypothetical protein